MNSKFAAHDINTHSLRSELVSRSQSGDKKASELLRALSKRTEENAGDLVVHYLRKAGSNSLETAMAGLGLVAFGLVVGIIGLVGSGMVTADFETLLVLLLSFVIGQWGLISYTKMSTARYYSQEFQKLANIVKVSSLVRQQYTTRQNRLHSPSLSLAYGSAA